MDKFRLVALGRSVKVITGGLSGVRVKKAIAVIGSAALALGVAVVPSIMTTDYKDARNHGLSYWAALTSGIAAVLKWIWGVVTSIGFLWPLSILLTILATLWFVRYVISNKSDEIAGRWKARFNNLVVANEMANYANIIRGRSDWLMDQNKWAAEPDVRAFISRIKLYGFCVPDASFYSKSNYFDKVAEWMDEVRALLNHGLVNDALAFRVD